MSFPFYAIFPTQISKKYSIVLCYGGHGVGFRQDRHKNIDLVQAEEMFLSMLKFLCEIVSSFKVKGHVL